MNLIEKKYIGGNYEHNEVRGTIDISTKYEENIDIPLDRLSSVNLHAGYWRKANAIHKWFVDNVQDGVDDCREYHVSYEDLQKLKQLCETILLGNNNSSESPALQLLPPQSGFFFGSIEIDECYYQDLKDTVNIISKLSNDADFYYRSSW